MWAIAAALCSTPAPKFCMPGRKPSSLVCLRSQSADTRCTMQARSHSESWWQGTQPDMRHLKCWTISQRSGENQIKAGGTHISPGLERGILWAAETARPVGVPLLSQRTQTHSSQPPVTSGLGDAMPSVDTCMHMVHTYIYLDAHTHMIT